MSCSLIASLFGEPAGANVPTPRPAADRHPPPHGAPRFGARVFAGREDGHAVDENVNHAGSVLMRPVVGRQIAPLAGVEDNAVGPVILA